MLGFFSVKNENVLTFRPRPNLFTYGDRYLNIIHTTLRHSYALNDLFRCNIINSPLCSCGKLEDIYHCVSHVINIKMPEMFYLMKLFIL